VSRAARPDLHHGLDVAVTDVADNARLLAIVDEQLSISGRLQVNTALAIMDTLADHLDRLRRRLLCTARGVKGARALMHDIYGVGPMSSLALCARSFGLALE
jgi:hypothetical protein